MQSHMEMAYQGWPAGTPMWTLMNVIVIVFALAMIVSLLRKKN